MLDENTNEIEAEIHQSPNRVKSSRIASFLVARVFALSLTCAGKSESTGTYQRPPRSSKVLERNERNISIEKPLTLARALRSERIANEYKNGSVRSLEVPH